MSYLERFSEAYWEFDLIGLSSETTTGRTINVETMRSLFDNKLNIDLVASELTSWGVAGLAPG